MKKIITIMLLVLCLCLCGCTPNSINHENEEDTPSMFTVVESTRLWKVVYHNDTKVMYAISYGSYNLGTFTLLVNPDGTPMLWEAANE